MEMLDYERKHISLLEESAEECTLFLKRNDAFPISSPCRVALFGNGARNTIKGGTGSGDVASRFFLSIESALEAAGFTVTTKQWLDLYDTFRKSTKKDYIKDGKRAAHKAHILPGVFTMGYFEEEKNYSFEPEGDGDIAIYVLSRNSGEGNDRRPIEGDVYLSKREVSDILSLNRRFENFILVLNVGGPVDLSPVLEVENILLLSQLGVVTGTTLVNIILGKANPSGKLSTTWAAPEDYPCFHEFGDRDETYYKEGVYVGYRYFDSAHIEPLFPFGHGLSYADFEVKDHKATIERSIVRVAASIKNIGHHAGKEVLQVYLLSPQGNIAKPYQALAAFAKTKELQEGESCEVETSFDIKDFGTYDEKNAQYVLEKGNYIVRVGTSSRNTTPVAYFSLENDIVVSKLHNECGKPPFEDLSFPLEEETLPSTKLEIDESSFETETVSYHLDEYIDPEIESLSDDELMLVTLGHHMGGFADIVGSSCAHVIGGAGETVLRVPSIKKSLTMADGPAGLRLKSSYGVDKKGIFDVVLDPMMEKMIDFLPKSAGPFVKPPKHRHGEIKHQYTTAIPIGTALAQSFNIDYVEKVASVVAEEMERFGVDLWLAPALNIHRNILCGRNFEYFSEDPLLSGRIAAAITRAIESHEGRGVTIKHFACNNQEFNRNNNNTNVSERALREIYLKGFEICIREAKPKAIMTSYNLINGVHTSESFELINGILRNEWGYEGLVMTDWIASGRSWCSKSKYPAPYAANNILAGNDLTMSGCSKDEKSIKKALRKGKLSRKDLLHSASRVYRSIKLQKGN